MTNKTNQSKKSTSKGWKLLLELNLELLIAALFCLNALDGIATIAWVSLELATEANPIMADLLSADPLIFMTGKLGLVALGSTLLWRLQKSPLATISCASMVLVYSGICLYHIDTFLFSL